MRVALVGLPQSGKSTLFAALAESEGSGIHVERPDQEHLAVLKVPDGRLDWLETAYHSKKRTYAEMGFLDVPGLDLSSEQARQRARVHWPAVRQSDMMVLVLRNFRNDTVPAYRQRLDVQSDLEELSAEMLFSDLEQVTARMEKLQAAVRKPSPQAERQQQEHELALMGRLRQALEAEQPLTSAIAGPAEEKLVRAFAFLTLKPAVVAVNCDEGGVPADPPARLAGYEAVYFSAGIEEELARLDRNERVEFMKELGIAEMVRDRLIRASLRAMNRITFFTVNQREARAWMVPAGTDALAAAGEIHSDMARGFIRAEVISFADLQGAGSEKAAKAAGKYRLEGKNHVLSDGDVVLFRFSV